MATQQAIKLRYDTIEEARLFEEKQANYIKGLILPNKYQTTLHNDSIYIYPKPSKHTRSALSFNFNTNIDTYYGLLNKHSQKRLRKCVDLLLQLSPITTIYNPCTKKTVKHRLSFITLTVSDTISHSHSEVYKSCLAPFLKTMRENWGVDFYVWKAELQQRGQIHYHITTNAFIPMDKIRCRWNNLQRKAGFIKNDHPPSTEIKEVQNIKNLAGYIEKYISKMSVNNNSTDESIAYHNNLPDKLLQTFDRFCFKLPYSEKTVCDDIGWGNIMSCYPRQNTLNVVIDGKVWDASDKLTRNKLFTSELSDNNMESIIKNSDFLNLDIVEFSNDFVNIWKIPNFDIKQVLPKQIKQKYSQYLKDTVTV